MDYNNATKEELITELIRLKQQAKYGLVFTRQEESVIEQCKSKMPVLKEITSRAVLGGGQDHALIEGDNYAGLLALLGTHKGKINCIYIDPPYNTGNKDFVYNDKFVDKEDGWRHSKWLSFMSERLKLAKGLLSDDGVIFISIDDNEQAQLKLLCDGIFGESNFINCAVWNKKKTHGRGATGMLDHHEYILIYCKNRQDKSLFGLLPDAKYIKQFKYEDDVDRYRLLPFEKSGNADQDRPKCKYPLIHSGISILPKKQWWRWGKETYEKNKHLVEFVKNKDGEYIPYTKDYLDLNNRRIIPSSIVCEMYNSSGVQDIKDIFGKIVFSNPKPKTLIKYIYNMLQNKSATILDFFAGSGTTFHAVAELNKEDGGNRQCILMTNNENQICEKITYQRCKKVIEGYTTPKGKVIEGTGGNLRYYKIKVAKADENKDQMRLNLKSKLFDQICLANNTYDLVKKTTGYKVYASDKLAVAFLLKSRPRYISSLIDFVGTIETPVKVYQAKTTGGIDNDLAEQFEYDDITFHPLSDDYIKSYLRVRNTNG